MRIPTLANHDAGIMGLKDRVSDLSGKVASEAKERGSKAYKAGSKVVGETTKSISDRLSNAWKQNLEPETREAIEEKIKASVDAAVDAKEVATGERMHREVMNALQRQEEYNDLLATKLEEALNRIDELEQKVEELSESRA